MKIYIARHGKTEWNQAKIFQGWKNSNLTEEGVESARKLKEKLKGISFDYIYSSPLGRALDTAKYIKDEDQELILIDELKEMGFGHWQGRNKDEIKDLYRDNYYNLYKNPELYQAEDGESFEQVKKRVLVGLEKIIKNGGNNVLLVSHGMVIQTIQSIASDLSLEDFWKPRFAENTSLMVLEYKEDRLNIIQEADISHL